MKGPILILIPLVSLFGADFVLAQGPREGRMLRKLEHEPVEVEYPWKQQVVARKWCPATQQTAFCKQVSIYVWHELLSYTSSGDKKEL